MTSSDNLVLIVQVSARRDCDQLTSSTQTLPACKAGFWGELDVGAWATGNFGATERLPINV